MRLTVESQDLIDEDRSGYLSREEVYDLILLMSKTEGEAKIKCQKLLSVIDGNKDGDVSYVEFARCHRRLPSLMQPAFILRRTRGCGVCGGECHPPRAERSNARG